MLSEEQNHGCSNTIWKKGRRGKWSNIWWFTYWDSTQSLRYKWGNYQDYLFERNLSLAYEKIVYWKKNLFLLPSGQAGKSFIDEMSRLMNEWIRESPLKDIAFKAIMVMPGLLLQKPSRKSKSKDHLTSLENRMKPWHAGEIMELLKETDTIQKDLRVSNTLSTITKISKIFLDNTKLKTVWIKITTFFKWRVSIILWSFSS